MRERRGCRGDLAAAGPRAVMRGGVMGGRRRSRVSRGGRASPGPGWARPGSGGSAEGTAEMCVARSKGGGAKGGGRGREERSVRVRWASSSPA